MSRYLADRILADDRIEVYLHNELRDLVGEPGVLEAVVTEDTTTGEHRTLPSRELMVFIGAKPCTDWLQGSVELDSGGYVRTGSGITERKAFDELGRDPLPLETSAPGVFAAGDVRSGSVQRVASAVGEGAMTVRLVHEHLSWASAHPLG
jgi:thioredoxin reductase (NADPH)